MNTEKEIVGTANSLDSLELLVKKTLRKSSKVKLLGQLYGLLFSGDYSQPELVPVMERLSRYSKSKANLR
jgi:hypothetical protein